MYNVGTKFFKFRDEENYDVVRLERIKNTDCFVVIDSDNNKIKLTKKELNEYTKIVPDGHISFCIAIMKDGLPDVIVSLFRKKDTDAGDTVPYAICRQNVFDVFSETVILDNQNKKVGCSINKDTCPVNITYQMFLQCEEITKVTTVDFYIEDNVDTILQFVNPVNYNSALYDLYRIMSVSTAVGGVTYSGYCPSLESLLKYNNFISDLCMAYDIVNAPLDMSDTSFESNIAALEDVVKHKILDPVVALFTREIDLSKIVKDYKLIRDSKGLLFIMAYKKGKYVNPSYEKLQDKSDIEAMIRNAAK